MSTARPHVLITGAAKRVGRATAIAFARAGCDVTITYRTSHDEARDALVDLAAHHIKAHAEQLDLDNLAAVERFGEEFAASASRLDVLVHNASIYFPTPLDETDADRAMALYRVNALAPLLLTKHLAPLLTKSPVPGGGCVVGMGDIHAMGRPRKDFAAYSMSKAALVEMVRSLARDLAPGARVVGVAPGVVKWPDEGHESDEESQRAYLKRVPLDRAGTPDDAAEMIRWLALEATYVTGQVIPLDGGRSLV